MDRFAPKPPIAIEGPVIRECIEPIHLTEQVTETEQLFVLAHAAVPGIEANEWSLEICGLVEERLSLSLDDLMAYPQQSVEAVLKCAGSPFDHTVPTRQVANVVWRGVDVKSLLADAGIDSSATHLWSYGLDYGQFAGHEVNQYVKDLPMSRIEQGDVLIAHTLNDAPLSPEHGYPARMVVPGFYGTNSVKWICRLELADSRPEGLFTTELYNDPDEGGGTKPVWQVEPESMFVFPQPGARLDMGAHEMWGRAWSSSAVVSVEVSFDGGATWLPAEVTPRNQHSWQTFSAGWHPLSAGNYRLQCRATDADGRTQPAGRST